MGVEMLCWFCLVNVFFWCAPFGYPCFLYFQLLNDPKLVTGIYPGNTLTPFPSSIERDSNPRPSKHESSTLTTRPDFCLCLVNVMFCKF